MGESSITSTIGNSTGNHQIDSSNQRNNYRLVRQCTQEPFPLFLLISSKYPEILQPSAKRLQIQSSQNNADKAFRGLIGDLQCRSVGKVLAWLIGDFLGVLVVLFENTNQGRPFFICQLLLSLGSNSSFQKLGESTDSLIPVVPPKANRRDPWDYDKELYKRRSEFECFFARIRVFRRICTRYDKLDVSSVALVYGHARTYVNTP